MLDEKDTLIMEELKKDGRSSTADIARRAGIPRVTVHERIRRMKEKGLIRRFTVLPDYKKLGLNTTAFILVTYDAHARVSQRQLADKIAKMANIYEVHILAGDWDLLLKVRGGSIEEIGKVVIDRLREFEGVGRTLTIACFETAKDEP
jgi:Lrp/AsnC family transcriptional regulator, leucine-responsive regulatory protein